MSDLFPFVRLSNGSRASPGPSRWLFRAVDRRRKLTNRRMGEVDVSWMIKRRAEAGGGARRHELLPQLPRDWAYLQNGGRWKRRNRSPNHESPRTTKLYDRSKDTLALDEIERITL